MTGHTLVIGYGNRLRSDDGLGPAAADIVGGWQLPGVEAQTVHQLVPELSEGIAKAERVLYIDAAVPGAIHRCFACDRIAPMRARPAVGHHETPANLLALVEALEGKTPEAWLMSIAASSFDPGDALTKEAERNLREALDWLRRWLTEQPCMKSA
jgi:hydrogenase maturation protease